MNFRDLNGRSAKKSKSYSDNESFRDIHAKNTKKEIVIEEVFPPEKTATKVTTPPMANQNIKQPFSTPINNYTQPSINYSNNIPPNQIPPMRNVNPPPNMPTNYTQNQFINYTQPMPRMSVHQKPIVPEPPAKQSEKPDPSKFIEEYVPTPPPKMVKARIPNHPKYNHSNNDEGAFGGTFDENPDQSTFIADIPVMDNINDYKI